MSATYGIRIDNVVVVVCLVLGKRCDGVFVVVYHFEFWIMSTDDATGKGRV